MADVIKGVGSSMPALDSLLPVIKRELRCEEAENRRDAVFCLGLIAEKQPAVVQNQIGTLLQVPLPPSYAFHQQGYWLKDNSILGA